MQSDPVFKARDIVPNRFVLCVVAIERVRQLMKGARPRTEKKWNSAVTTALQEVADRRVVQEEKDGHRFKLA